MIALLFWRFWVINMAWITLLDSYFGARTRTESMEYAVWWVPSGDWLFVCRVNVPKAVTSASAVIDDN